jgi:hypothetical protein
MVLAIGGQHGRSEFEDGGRLTDVAKGRGSAGMQFVEPVMQLGKERFPGSSNALTAEVSERIIQLALPAWLGPAIGEVQIPHQGLAKSRVELCMTIVHRLHLLRIVPVPHAG